MVSTERAAAPIVLPIRVNLVNKCMMEIKGGVCRRVLAVWSTQSRSRELLHVFKSTT
jgi:hypothetical protein